MLNLIKNRTIGLYAPSVFPILKKHAGGLGAGFPVIGIHTCKHRFTA